jgi:hypothetical protein
MKAMVPRIEITRPSKGEAPEDAVWRRRAGALMSDANGDVPGHPDWDDEGKRYSQETVDELDSSVSGMSSEMGGEKKTSWEERMKWWKIYALHFLFMWNSRTFEYVSVRFSELSLQIHTDLEDLSCCLGFSRQPYCYFDKVSCGTPSKVTC